MVEKLDLKNSKHYIIELSDLVDILGYINITISITFILVLGRRPAGLV